MDTPDTLPQIVGDEELVTPPAETPTDGPEPLPQVIELEPQWQPPSKEEWDSMQTLLTNAHDFISEHYNRSVKDKEPDPVSDPWDSDPDLKAIDKDDRQHLTKQVFAALRSAGIDPEKLKQTQNDIGSLKEEKRYRAFDAERQSVRAAYGAANVDALDGEIRKLMETRPLSYEESYFIVKNKAERSKRVATAQTQAKAAASKAVTPSPISGLGSRPATVISPTKQMTVSDLPPEKQRNLADMMKHLGEVWVQQ